MLTKDQENTVVESLLQMHKEQPYRGNTPAPVRKWSPFGMLLGMGTGAFVSIFVTGHAMPGMSFGMLAGALLGAYFDKQIRPRFLVAIVGLLGLGGLLLWYLARAFS